MTAFTIFYSTKTGKYAAVYDCNLPTQTGIGDKATWVPVFHGQTTGLCDKNKQ